MSNARRLSRRTQITDISTIAERPIKRKRKSATTRPATMPAATTRCGLLSPATPSIRRAAARGRRWTRSGLTRRSLPMNSPESMPTTGTTGRTTLPVSGAGFRMGPTSPGGISSSLPPLADYTYSVSEIEKKIGGEFSFFPLAPDGVKDSYSISDWPGLSAIAGTPTK